MTSFVYDQITYVLFSNYTAEVGYNVPNAAQIPENLVIPPHIPYNNNNYLVTSVCQNAFFQVSKMKTVQLPESIIIIKNNAFDICSIPGDLFQIPSGVKIIENYCFSTNSFKKVIIPKTVESIGICPFGNNLNLETIEVEKGSNFFVTDSQHILYNKKQTILIQVPSILEVANIPSTVSIIKLKAFDQSDVLKYIYINGDLREVSSTAFSRLNALEAIYYFGKRGVNKNDIYDGFVPKSIICCENYDGTKFGAVEVTKYGPCYRNSPTCRIIRKYEKDSLIISI